MISFSEIIMVTFQADLRSSRYCFLKVSIKRSHLLIPVSYFNELLRRMFTPPGPGCSKLTTSLVNFSLKFQMLISEICHHFLLKKCEAFALQKLLLFFQQEISVYLVIKS